MRLLLYFSWVVFIKTSRKCCRVQSITGWKTCRNYLMRPEEKTMMLEDKQALRQIPSPMAIILRKEQFILCNYGLCSELWNTEESRLGRTGLVSLDYSTLPSWEVHQFLQDMNPLSSEWPWPCWLKGCHICWGLVSVLHHDKVSMCFFSVTLE